MFGRREFLRRASLVALAPSVPAFLGQAARAATGDPDRRVLVVIQLDGGNDGINTVVPFGDDAYGQHRRRLRLAADQLIKLDDHVGLHPSLGDFGRLWETGRLAVVQGVGYPNPDRSHDVSMAIWQTCQFERTRQTTHGWLGRALDQTTLPPDGSPGALLVGDEQPPVALRGRRSVAAALNRLDEFKASSATINPLGTVDDSDHDLAAFVRRSTLDAYTTAQRLNELAPRRSSGTIYPSSELAARLNLAARLIQAGFGTRVFYTVQSGYDTHAAQLPLHANLLRDLSQAVAAFLDDLQSAGLADRVLVLCFSEFGRRVEENASLGTDHGTAAPVFVAGAPVTPGLFAPTPRLGDLDDGDLKMSVDFRQVYATILERWLDVPSPEPLAGNFTPIDFLKPA